MNPFANILPISDPEKLFGRRREMKGICATIAARQCISLRGLPRIGKTSVLRCLSLSEVWEQFELDIEHRIFEYIDMQEYLPKTLDDFFESLSNSIVSHHSEKLTLTYQAGMGANAFANILDQITKQNYHLVLMMDMFDEIVQNVHFNDVFLGFLRAQVMRGRISYITASIKSLYEITHHSASQSPFFNIFVKLDLGPLSEEDARQLIMGPLQQPEQRFAFTEEEVAWVLQLAGLHPFFLQRVCYHLFEAKSSLNASQENQSAVRDEAYSDLHSHFEYIWGKLSEEQQASLKYEAQREQVRQRKLPELAGSALFRKFVRDMFHLQSLEMVKELETTLEKIDNLKALGESNLVYLKVVSQKLSKRDSLLPVEEKGVAVLEVLKEALKRLQATGIRSDSDPLWRSYNILYYRYFRNHLKNEQNLKNEQIIGARLGFTSIGEYNRDRAKALEKLAEALTKMEEDLAE